MRFLAEDTRSHILEVAILRVPVEHVREFLTSFLFLKIRGNVRVVVYSVIPFLFSLEQVLPSPYLLQESHCVQEIWLIVMFM